MKPRDYMTIAFKNVRRQPLRSLLTIAALTISTCVLTLMVAISLGGQRVILNQFGSNDSLSLITVTPNQSGAGLSPFGDVQQAGDTNTIFTDNTVAQLAALPHVQLATPRAHLWEFDTMMVSQNSKPFVAQVEGLPSDAFLPLAAGVPFSSNDQSNVIIVGYGYAKATGLASTPGKLLGQTMTLTTQKDYRGVDANIPTSVSTKSQNDAFAQSSTVIQAKIVGVTQAGVNQNIAFVPMGWAHQIRTAHYYEAGLLKSTDQLTKDGYTTIQVKVDSLANVQTVSSAIKNLGYGQTSLLETAKQLNQLTTTVSLVLGAVACIAMLAAALGVVNTMIMTVTEQRYEIGIWRACGAKRGVIVRLFLMEATVLGLLGGIVGVGVSIPVAGFITQYGSSLLESQGLQSVTIAQISPWLGAGAIGVTIAFSVIAGLYPAYRAARLDPSQVLSSN
ncbi:MAG TPA: FtsX-like permease family protein [Candidatus Chromulinivoraceae bacterium]|nr:FtsX-like permease family protein [Candidatus Chromulinivoraceae bacterium]